MPVNVTDVHLNSLLAAVRSEWSGVELSDYAALSLLIDLLKEERKKR